MKSPLRDLADLIQRTAMTHPAYGQASSAVLNCVDHLCAIARCEEVNRGQLVENTGWRFKIGDDVQKKKGSSWQGRVVGLYSTSLTPRGYAVESIREPGSVQIYPEAALTFS